jgi:hypothetical protein
VVGASFSGRLANFIGKTLSAPPLSSNVDQEDSPSGSESALGARPWASAAPFGPVPRLTEGHWAPGSAEDRLADLVRAVPRAPVLPFAPSANLARMRGGLRSGRINLARACGLGILLAGAVAAAAQGPRLLARSSRPAVPSAGVAAVSAAPGPARGPGSAKAPEAVSENMVESVVPAATPPARVATAGRHSAMRALGHSSGRTGDDPTLVLGAIAALRGGRDPARASALLAEYLRTEPTGVLVEDALALSVEAAAASHDAQRTTDLGERYIERFPQGRYGSFVVQAMRAVSGR